MMHVIARSIEEAYCEVLQRLLSSSSKFNDPEIFREEVAVISIKCPTVQENSVTLENNLLHDPFPYSKYFPHISLDFINNEIQYWNQQFMGEHKLSELITYLQNNPLSKRGIILFWEDRFRDLSKGAVCEVAAFFRIKNNSLEMHTHMRANNASFLLFMDMHFLMGIQNIVANQLGLDLGEYVHFIDSLHIYETEKDIALHQQELTINSDPWTHKETYDL